MREIAGGSMVSSSEQKDARRFLTLAIAYSIIITLVGFGLYYWLVIPLWLCFAFLSTRFGSGRFLRRATRLLILSVVLWIAFIVPLFFFVVWFTPLFYAAEVSAILIGSTIMYAAAIPFSSGDPRLARARRTGLAAAVATAANSVVSPLFVAFGGGMTTYVVAVAVVDTLFIVGLVASVISSLSFIRIGTWARRQPLERAQT